MSEGTLISDFLLDTSAYFLYVNFFALLFVKKKKKKIQISSFMTCALICNHSIGDVKNAE